MRAPRFGRFGRSLLPRTLAAAMPVSALHVDLRFGVDLTARQRRRLVLQIARHLRRRFNVAVAEIGPPDVPATATLAVASAAPTRREAREILVHVADALDGHPLAEVAQRRFDDFA